MERPACCHSEFRLIADDPDAPIGTSVIGWSMTYPQICGPPQNLPKNEQSADGSRQGRNDFGKIGYGGPFPPPGKPHRYFFSSILLMPSSILCPALQKKTSNGPARPHPGPGRIHRPLLALTIFPGGRQYVALLPVKFSREKVAVWTCRLPAVSESHRPPSVVRTKQSIAVTVDLSLCLVTLCHPPGPTRHDRAHTSYKGCGPLRFW